MKSRIREMVIGKTGLLALLVAAMLISSCAGGANVKDGEPEAETGDIKSEAKAGGGSEIKASGAVFSDVQGKEWILAEVKGASGTTRLDRQKLDEANFKGAYSLNFEADLLSGMGAPNRFRGPYTAGEGQTLTIGNIAATLMMGLSEVPGLAEYEYFTYLRKVTRWDVRGNTLELYTSDNTGAEKVLIFTAQ